MEYVCEDAGAAFSADFSCVSPPPATGIGNIDVDPLFVDAANGDLRLSVGSPCIDKGTNLAWMATSTDLDGKPRIFNGRADMGADEANILHVWTTSPADGPGTHWSNAFHTIQAAADASVDFGTVLVTNGTYILANQIVITTGVGLRSTGGSALTTVDGNGAVGCLSITHPQAVVEGFTITRGLNTESELGGGVYMTSGTLKNCTIVSNSAGFRGGGVHFDYGGMVSNCTIEGNSSEEGAGIYFTYGGVVRGSRIIGNTATGRGGGMRFEGGGLLEGSTVIGNSGAMGGGSAMRFDFIGGVATNCTVTRNTSTDGGGVIRFSGGGSLYGCTISNNFSSGETVFQDSGTAAGTAVNCQIIGNISDSGPGSCKYMTDCTIALNQATNGSGGGLSLRAGYVAVGCLIISNSASDGGGGVEMGEGASLLNCTSLWNTASWGAGVNCWGGNNRISGCVIANNETTINCGGGVACGLEDTVVDSIVASNTAPTGGGIWFNEGGVASNCLIHGNTADYGGGVGCYLGGTVQDCTISDNTAWDVGGGVLWNEGGKAVNCLITGSRSSGNGSGVDCYRGGEVLNCTIYGSSGFMGWGYGVFFNEGGTVRNSILQNNSDWSYNGGGWTMEYSCYSMMGPSSPGPGNITDDPQFIDAAGGDFRLATNSPCVDKGTNADWMVGATDLEGKPRIINGTADMGAYEAIPPAWDTDGDLIPDWWTWKYFGHFTGMPDDHSMATNCADGTGVNNLYKYMADLDPTNPVSVFKVDAVSNYPSVRLVCFAGSPDRVYTLNWTTNLVSGSWTNVPDQTCVPGSGPGTSLSDTNADAQRFYRLDVRMP
jgi:parallel beta-helix repeat protein